MLTGTTARWTTGSRTVPEWWAGFAYGVMFTIAMGITLYGLVNMWLDRRDRMAEVQPRHRDTAGQKTKRIRP